MNNVEFIEIARPSWDKVTNAHLQRLASEGWYIANAWSIEDGYVIIFEREVRDGQ